MNDTLTGDVTGLAFGGQGIVRQDNLVTFIPFAAIGDTLSYKIVKKKKNFANGEILNVIKPSKDRIKPACPYFGTCGGCQLQHLNYASQLAAKRQWIEDAILRQAKIKDVAIPDVIPAKEQWQYRRKVMLTLRRNGQGYISGFIPMNHGSLLEINQCTIFTEEKDPIFSEIQEIAKQLEAVDDVDARGTVLKRNDSTYLLHFHFKTMPKNAQKVLDDAKKRYKSLTGIIATAQKITCKAGSFETSFNIEDLTFDFSPQAFIQNHPEQSLKIYNDLCDLIEKTSPKTILDLYCGIGVSTLMISKKLHHLNDLKIFGVESNNEAIRLATENAQKNKITNVSYTKAFVEEVLKNLLSKKRPDVVIVNPPREGLTSQAVTLLLENPPPSLIYISCMPATLSRDIKLLCDQGYTLKSVQGYDMFPQTTHVETMAYLTR